MPHYVLLMGDAKKASTNADVDEYNKAINMTKAGLEMAMDGLDGDSKSMAVEGIATAWEGMKKVCELSKKMKEQFGEPHDEHPSARYSYKEWTSEDDHVMERRVHDDMNRFK